MAATGLALVPLVLIIYYLLYKGLGSWSGTFFTTDPNGNFFGNPGGVRSAILGTLEIVGLATLISVPIGIAVALYLTEYGKDGPFANVVRYFVDVMTGVPSIVFGLFIYIVLVISHFGGSGFAGWKGALALSLLMLPIVIRSAEVVLLLVPASLREAALALGAPRWRIVWRVVLPTARSGLVTGSLLAVARGMGETAPLLFTVSAAFTLSGNLNGLDEHAAGADLRGHHQSPRRGRRARLGRRADPGRTRPHSQSDRASGLAKEPHGMIPPETTSKERQEMSTAPGQSEAGTAPDPSAMGERRTGHGIKVSDLHAYYGPIHAIRGVNIDFPPNEVTAIIGPSGCGKSTMVRCINRMHEEIPGARSEGSVSLDGLDVYGDGVDVTAVRRMIGMVFQKPNPFPTMSVFDNVAAGLRLTGTKSDNLRERVHRALRAVGLWGEVKNRLNAPGIGLSGGQQQRLCIARAVAVEPEVILMDEPASALDPIATLKVEELIDELKSRYTIVIVTHNMQQAARVAKSTVFMLDGEVIEHAETTKLFTNPSDERTERYVTGKFG